MSPGIYIHVPYCASKCAYCSFNSYETAGGVPAVYVDALISDIGRSASAWRGAEFGSVYLGGGTPSLLGPGELERLLAGIRARYPVADGAEITLEANPSSLSLPKLKAYRGVGVNRLSVGVQSLEARELHTLGRLHSPEEATAALENARVAGFGNLSADVMVGVPGQTSMSLTATLSALIPLVSHVSCYLLSVDPGTRMADMVRSGAVVLADESLVVELYETLGRELGRHGFARYEISNWARQGWESRHNLTYWGRGEYLGLGAGASSYRRGERYRRIEEPGAYVDAALSGGDPVSFRETLSREDALAEEVMLSLRTERGLDLDRLAREYGSDLAEVESLLEHFSTEGLIVRNRKEVRLSAKGILVSDAIIEDLASVLAVS